ncbi:uncharacterized protein [Argopecten irradians]|uniref:uncharacterized protein n=1 Tax=Argopecten irradians TaxID=31199 RepID=UPI003714BB10
MLSTFCLFVFAGSKKHPLSPYTYNREPEYIQQIRDEVDRSHKEKIAEGHRSPNWAIETSRESNHSGESPLFVHGLLSSSKHGQYGQHLKEPRTRSLVRGRSAPPKRSETLYYRPNTTHQYLSATELHQTQTQSSDATNIKYGRPTRTTLLRARQRSNSAPVNAYTQRRESAKKMESTQYSTINTTPRDGDDYSSDEDNDYMTFMYLIADRYMPVRKKEDSTHAFLTGARYNRAHLLDAKGLSVYGVYMPRKNPLACFMTGPASSRLKGRAEEVPAPPDTPRSEVSDTHDQTRKPEYHTRPSTAPGKRLLSGKMATPRDRPKSAWGDAATSCDIIQNESENLANDEAAFKQLLLDDLILTPNGLNVQGSRVLVSLRSSRQSLRVSESTLPSVTGISVPKVISKRLRDPVEETSLVNQPPPTPIGGLSVVESERVRKASLSVKDSSIGRMEDSTGPVIKKHINVELMDHSIDQEDTDVSGHQVNNTNEKRHQDPANGAVEAEQNNTATVKDDSDESGLKVFMTENNNANEIEDVIVNDNTGNTVVDKSQEESITSYNVENASRNDHIQVNDNKYDLGECEKNTANDEDNVKKDDVIISDD